jgi:alkanesulfonate monooxygenase SsuD/methylene tetrahydromethanopterin reductase-like flavin-dependent oxidoreductase (luciferase family)
VTVADRVAFEERVALHGTNKLKLGLFSPNCSSGRAATTVPERWSASWRDNLRLARDADDAGMDFILPIGRWRGYGGETDFQGESFETISWACGLLAATRHITVFGTVHVPLFHPVVAAKQFVTADHIGEGRFGLNIVPGCNADEQGMFGPGALVHDARYEQAQEWLDVVKRAWTAAEDFDFEGRFDSLRGVRAKPKPFGGSRPAIMNAGSSPRGRTFAIANCDAFFTGATLDTFESAAANVAAIRAEARSLGHEIGVFTTGDVICRPTKREAEEYRRYVAEEHADWGAVEYGIRIREMKAPTDPAEYQAYLRKTVLRLSGFSMVGTPDDVTDMMARVSGAGFDGIGFSFVNYNDEFRYFRDEVLPRLERAGLRRPR